MKSILDVSVSCYPSYHKPDNPKPVNLLTWLRSAKYKEAVEKIRSLPDKTARDALKATLPAITPSGLFSRRAEAGLLSHSGFICLDIDYKDNRQIHNFAALHDQLCHIENIAYLGLSVSGQGYFALVPLAFPEQHKAHFIALSKDFARLGIALDESCKDVCRLRGYSYDADAYFNPYAKPYSKIHSLTGLPACPQPHKKTTAGKDQKDQPLGFASLGGGEQAAVESLIEQLTTRQLDLTADYRHWFEIGCSLAHAFGEAGESYFHQVSRFHPAYDAQQTEKQFQECLKKRYNYSIATFFKYCKDAGVVFMPAPEIIISEPMSSASQLNKLLLKNPALSAFIADLDLQLS